MIEPSDIAPEPAYPRLTLRRMLRSKAVWAIATAHICINWSLYLVLSWFPTFVNRELGADLQLAGFLALAPDCHVARDGAHSRAAF